MYVFILTNLMWFGNLTVDLINKDFYLFVSKCVEFFYIETSVKLIENYYGNQLIKL